MIHSIEELIQEPDVWARVNEALQEVIGECEGDVAVVAVPLPDSTDYLVWAATPYAASLEPVSTPIPSSPFCREMMRSGRPIVIDDIRTLPKEQNCCFMAAEELNGFLGAPLSIRNGTPDVLMAVMAREARPWSEGARTVFTEAAQNVQDLLKGIWCNRGPRLN